MRDRLLSSTCSNNGHGPHGHGRLLVTTPWRRWRTHFSNVARLKILIFLLAVAFIVVLLIVYDGLISGDPWTLDAVAAVDGGLGAAAGETSEPNCLKSLSFYLTGEDSASGDSDAAALTALTESSAPPPRSALTGVNNGRLGNQMFLYAALLIIAKQNNRSASVFMSPTMADQLSKYFKVTIPAMSPTAFGSISWTTVELTKNAAVSLPAATAASLNEPFVKFSGFPESYKYFESSLSEIRAQFQFHRPILTRAEMKIIAAKNEFARTTSPLNVTVVGVHVRRQDYIDYGKKIGLELPTIEFYVGAMTYFTSRYGRSNVIFIVASDDVEWCLKNFKAPNVTGHGFQLTFLNGSVCAGGLDLAVLTRCDHVIFGFGTFGFWGGLLAGGETVFCSDCILPRTTWIKVLLDYRNFVLPGWVGFDRKGRRSSTVARFEDLGVEEAETGSLLGSGSGASSAPGSTTMTTNFATMTFLAMATFVLRSGR